MTDSEFYRGVVVVTDLARFGVVEEVLPARRGDVAAIANLGYAHLVDTALIGEMLVPVVGEYHHTVMVSQIRVRSRDRGRGVGRRLLEFITKQADDRGVWLALAVAPDAYSPMDELATALWYGRNGFAATLADPGLMIRPPS